MERVRDFRRERRYMKSDGWILECGRKERREEEGNANGHGNDAKSTNGKKRR